MRPNKPLRRDEDRQEAPPRRRTVGKSRYTNAAPMTASTVERGDETGGEFEVRVGDFTLVVKPDEPEAASPSKYAARPGLGYGDVPGAGNQQDATEEAVAVVASVELDDEDPIPEWGAWRTQSNVDGSRYTRTETRR